MMNFVSQEPFQNWLDILWFGRIQPPKDLFNFFLVIFTLPFAWIPGVLTFFRIKFRKDATKVKFYQGPEKNSSKIATTSINDAKEMISIDKDHDGPIANLLLQTQLTNKQKCEATVNFNFYKQIQYYYSSPFIKFLFHGFSMFTFLITFAIFLLMQFCYLPKLIELVVTFWMVCIFLNEIRTTYSRLFYLNILCFGVFVLAIYLKVMGFYYDRSFSLFLEASELNGFSVSSKRSERNISVICADGQSQISKTPAENFAEIHCETFCCPKFFPKFKNNNFCPRVITHDSKSDYFYHSLNLYNLAFTLSCGRFMYFFSVSRTMGPLLIAITRMVKDMSNFILIMIILMVTFGVTTTALLYPNDWRPMNIVIDLIGSGFLYF